MDTVTQQIDKWIANEGKGNVRDALNVALSQLEAAHELVSHLRKEVLKQMTLAERRVNHV